MKQATFWFTLIMCFLLLTAPVFGAVKATETQQSDAPLRVRLIDRLDTPPDDEGDFLLVLSDAQIGENHTGDIYVLFGNVTLAGRLDGTVYTFSSTVAYTDTNTPEIKPLIGLLAFAGRSHNEDGMTSYTDVIPNQILLLFWIVAETLICMMLYPLKPGFMEQGAVLLFEEPITVLRNGLTAYFFFIALMVIFWLTVFLLPLSVGFLAIMQGMIWVGEVSLSITAGWLLATRLLKRDYGTGFMVGGLIVIGLIKCIPVISLPFTYLFMPIISLGLVSTGFINGWITRKYYETPFHEQRGKKVFDISAIRGMIMNNGKP